MIVLYGLLIISLRGLYTILKNKSGRLPCKGIVGRIMAHNFVESSQDRVCRICGLVQVHEDRGFLMSEPYSWYDKGYAENTLELVKYYSEKNRLIAKANKNTKQAHIKTISDTKISTPGVQKVATKEVNTDE